MSRCGINVDNLCATFLANNGSPPHLRGIGRTPHMISNKSRTCPAKGGMNSNGINITRKMRIALLMIREDNHYICEWQTILRLTEAGFISYIDGRARITPMGRELLSMPYMRKDPACRGTGPASSSKLSCKPGLARAKAKESKECEAIAKKYDRYG